MKFQYFSDIHTENYKSNPKKLMRILTKHLEAQAPYLILAGDIGDPFSQIYVEFLEYVSRQFEHIFMIAGNHEYYTKEYKPQWMLCVQKQIRLVISRFNNITFLENEVYDIPNTNISIFGATFWSDIKNEESIEIEKSIGDYKFIPEFNIEKSRDLHKESCDKLNAILETERNLIVISHHLPSYNLIVGNPPI